MRGIRLTIAIETKTDEGKEELSGAKADGNKIHHSHAADARVGVRVGWCVRSFRCLRESSSDSSTEARCRSVGGEVMVSSLFKK